MSDGDNDSDFDGDSESESDFDLDLDLDGEIGDGLNDCSQFGDKSEAAGVAYYWVGDPASRSEVGGRGLVSPFRKNQE